MFSIVLALLYLGFTFVGLSASRHERIYAISHFAGRDHVCPNGLFFRLLGIQVAQISGRPHERCTAAVRVAVDSFLEQLEAPVKTNVRLEKLVRHLTDGENRD
jgi:hypothetical protein